MVSCYRVICEFFFPWSQLRYISCLGLDLVYSYFMVFTMTNFQENFFKRRDADTVRTKAELV